MGVSVSGSMKQDIGFGSYVGGEMSTDDIHFETDATITFTATGTTDGGLAVTAAVDLKGKGPGVIDASHLTIGGAFGSINLGQNGHASNLHGNKGIGGGYGHGGYYDCGEHWTPAVCGGPPGNDKGVGIRYSTPSIAGFQAGVSFQPEAGATVSTSTENDKNVTAVGANFTGDFAGTSLTLGGGWVSKDPGGIGDAKTSWGLGATVGVSGTSLNLRYDAKNDNHANALDTGMGDSTSFGIGIDHTIGSLTFGIGYGTVTDDDAVLSGVKTVGHFENVPDTGDHPRPAAGDPDPSTLMDGRKLVDRESSIIALGATYVLGGGVTISAGINSGKIKNMQVNSNPSPVYACRQETEEAVGNRCYAATDLVDPYYMDATGALKKVSDDVSIAAVIPLTHSLTYAVTDIDDVGVGLRIALSF